MIVPEPTLRRVLVAVDTATHSEPCIECAAELAARLQAELIGLFIEDDELLRMAALPGASRVSFLTGAQEGLDLASTERELRSIAGSFRRQLAAAAERSRVKWSFRVVRGRVTREVARAAENIDVLVVSRSARPLMAHVRLEAAAHGAPEEVQASVLLLPENARIEGPVLVVYDGTPDGDDALRVAARLASRGNGQLEVLLFTNTAEAASRLERLAHEQVEGYAIALQYHVVPGPVAAASEAWLRDSGRLLVLGEGHPPQLAGVIRALADRLDCPILTVRRSR